MRKARSKGPVEAAGQTLDVQRTIDEIVECFFRGKKGSIARASTLYKEKLFDQEGHAPERVASSGDVMPDHRLEANGAWDVEDRLEDYATEQRLKAIAKGAKLTLDERKEYRRRVIAEVKGGGADADVIPGYWVSCLRHTDGREVFALATVKGYSFSGIEETFDGLFPTLEDALTDLSTWGLVISG